MEILNDNLAQKLPGPLSDAYFAFINERDDQPFRKVHRLIDLIEVFCKIYTVGSVATFLDTLRLKMDEPYHAISEDAFIKIKVTARDNHQNEYRIYKYFLVRHCLLNRTYI